VEENVTAPKSGASARGVFSRALPTTSYMAYSQGEIKHNASLNSDLSFKRTVVALVDERA